VRPTIAEWDVIGEFGGYSILNAGLGQSFVQKNVLFMVTDQSDLGVILVLDEK